MRPEREAADRAEAVRQAARGWHRAGAIDAATLAAVHQAYADDHFRFRPALRALVFVLTVVAISGALGFLSVLFAGMLSEAAIWVPLLLVYGGGLLAVTELLARGKKLLRAGAEEATALLGAGCLLGSLGIAITETFRNHTPAETAALFGVTLFAAAMLFGALAWRWGMVWAGGLAAAAFLLGLLQLPAPRLLWLAAGLGLAPFLLARGRSGRFPPSHRAALRVASAVGLVALYAAVNLSGFDRGWLERLFNFYRAANSDGPAALRWLAIAGTVLLPFFFLWMGLRRRDRLWLNAGLLAGCASLATIRDYFAVAPLWLVLTGAGLLLIALALGLRRFLDAGPEHARAGWTAEPLYEDEEARSAAEIAAGLVALSPDARKLDAPASFEGKGGHFGGGGAESTF